MSFCGETVKSIQKKQKSTFFRAPHCSRLINAKKYWGLLYQNAFPLTENSFEMWSFWWLYFFVRRLNLFWKSSNLRDTVPLGRRPVSTVFLQCLFCFQLSLILRKLILHLETFFKAHLSVNCFRAWLLFILKLLLKIRNGEGFWSFYMPHSFLVLGVFLLKTQVYILTFMEIM